MSSIDWKDYIYSNPEILLGQPIIRGTRLSVEFLLGILAEGWTEKQILDNYLTLTKESLRAVFAFTTECMKDEFLFLLPTEAI